MEQLMEQIISLCKRRGFIFPSSEIYGGITSCWDFGPLGVELKNNVKRAWWRAMVQHRDDMVGLDAAILMNPMVWQASGHVQNFTDPMVDCKSCKERFRADQIETEKCPNCGGELTEPRKFNLMFRTFMGPVEDDAAVVYLRPETAQGIYVNFVNVQASMRRKLPFGIAQVGKSFRNEISPGNFIFRSREFEQMEMQFFVEPGTDDAWFETWQNTRMAWYHEYGVTPEHLRFRDHGKDEIAHYAKRARDIEYQYPFGWKELEGIHSRTDFDLKRHAEFSGKDLQYFDDVKNTHYIPYVIETAVGADRATLIYLLDAYHEEEVRGETRVVLKLDKRLAPIKVAVMPLSKKENLVAVAKEVAATLRPHVMTQYDETGGAIGRRYRRQDEIGTPYCVTVDFDTLEDKAVTIRERDSMEQVRVPIAELAAWMREQFPC